MLVIARGVFAAPKPLIATLPGASGTPGKSVFGPAAIPTASLALAAAHASCCRAPLGFCRAAISPYV